MKSSAPIGLAECYARPQYKIMLQELDKGVGKILDALNESSHRKMEIGRDPQNHVPAIKQREIT